MDRSKIIAIVTGAIALLISVAYLLLVQFLDFRGGMQPAPITGQVSTAQISTNGEGGIRTPDEFDPITDFESAAFDHSATSPGAGLS